MRKIFLYFFYVILSLFLYSNIFAKVNKPDNSPPAAVSAKPESEIIIIEQNSAVGFPLYDLKNFSETIPDVKKLKEYQVVEGNQKASNLFFKGFDEFNKNNYYEAQDCFCTSILNAPWEKKYFDWYEKALYKLGEYYYLKDYYEKLKKYNYNTGESDLREKFILNCLKYAGNQSDTVYKLFNVIEGFDWKSKKFITPADIIVSDKEIYISCPSLKVISVINKNFELIDKFSFTGKVLKLFQFNDSIYTFEFDKNKIYKIRNKNVSTINTGKINLIGIKGLAVDKYENIYVIDSGNKRVLKIKNGKILLEVGGVSDRAFKFDDITDIIVDYKCNIYTVDNINKKINKFDSSGNLVLTFDFAAVSENIKRLKYKNGYIYALSDNNQIMLFDEKLVIRDNIKVNNAKGKKSDAFEIDNFKNLYLSNFSESKIYIYKNSANESIPIIIHLNSIESKEHFPVIAFHIDVKDIYGNPVYGLNKDNLTVYEGFLPKDESKLYTYNFILPADDLRVIKFKKLFLVYPVNMRNEKEFKLSQELELSTLIIDDTTTVEKFVDTIDFQKTKLNVYLSKPKKVESLFKETTDKYQVKRVLKNIKFSQKKNIYSDLIDIIKNVLKIKREKALFLFIDEPNLTFNKNELEHLINISKSNNIKIFIYSISREKNNDLNKLCSLTGGRYNLFPEFNFTNDLQYLYHQQSSEYVITFETGYTGMKFNTYIPVYLFIDFYGMKGGLLTGYLTP